MFFLLKLEQQMLIQPMWFGRELKEHIKEELYEKVEGKVQADKGHVVSVVKIDEIGKCEIIPGRGHAICNVKYQAIVFMPFQGEVVEGVITTVHMTGLFVQVGPVTVFVMAGTHMPNLTYDGNANCYRGDDGESVVLRVDDSIRLKIFKVSMELTKINVLGTLAGNYLHIM